MTSKIQNSPDSPISHDLFAKESELLTQSSGILLSCNPGSIAGWEKMELSVTAPLINWILVDLT